MDALELARHAVVGDLARRALDLAKVSASPQPDPALDELIRLVRAAGGHCAHDLGLAPHDPEALAKAAGLVAGQRWAAGSDELLSKVLALVGPLASAGDLAAARGELLATVESIADGVAQVAALDIPAGGPMPVAGQSQLQRRDH